MAYNKSQKLAENLKAIAVAFLLERENRRATPAEQEVLRKYNGFGGLKFILNNLDSPDSWKAGDRQYYPLTQVLFNTIRENSKDEREYDELVTSVKSSVTTAFFTPDAVITAISRTLAASGIVVRRFLDPSSGNGKFLDVFREEQPAMEAFAFEKDLLTGKVLKALHPDDKVIIGGFETIPQEVLGTYDVVSSNIPFGDIRVFDPVFSAGNDVVRKSASKTLHNYFFLKSLDAVRDGGLVAFITSRGVMDSPSNEVIRSRMLEEARLVSAIRLPDGMFSDIAGTEAGSDLIILQKMRRPESRLTEEEKMFRTSVVNSDDIRVNSLFDLRDGVALESKLAHILSDEAVVSTNMYGNKAYEYRFVGDTGDLAYRLESVLEDDFRDNLDLALYESNLPKRVQEEKILAESVKRPTVSGPVQLDLFSMWDAIEEEKISMEPRPFRGDIRPNWYDGTIVVDGDQLGMLSQLKTSPTFTPMDLNGNQTAILKQYIKVRDSYDELYRTEAEDRREHVNLREQLNIDYDNFLVKFGHLNDRKNQKIIILDASGRDAFALEYSDGEKFVKADIFERPVSFNVRELDHVDNPTDALSASLNKSGGVDLEYMSDISGISVDDLKEQLRDRIFFNPLIDGYEVADKFLAGNVVEKYDRLYGWKGSTKGQMQEIQRSLAALEEKIPTPIAFEDLDFNFGERWMPTEYFSEFATRFFGADIKIDYAPQLDEFIVDPQESVYDKVKITTEYAVVIESGKTVDGLDLLRHALYNTVPNIQHVVGYKPNGDPIMGPDHEKIQLAASKIDDIRDHFTEWINDHDKEWKDGIAEMYNKKYNCFVRAEYDGSHQIFPGLDLKSLTEKKNVPSIYSSQKDAIWMLLQNGGGICDHEVGTGKTLIMCIAAHEMKRLGMANKPVIIGMKANVSEIAATYQAAYPSDRLLYATPKDFSDRQSFFNRMKNNDYDCIIMSHDQFAMIPQSLETQQHVMQEEIRALEEALEVYGRSHSISGRMLSGLEKRKANLVASLKQLNWTLAHRADDVVDFKTMGIDHIFVDESQAFKNLAFTTRDNHVAGLGDPKGSQRARNLQYAIRTIQERTGRDLGASFLSGTTISNSLTELYLLFKYLRPKALSRQDINSFDAWAAVFAKKSRDYEIIVAGQVVMKERFRNFIKVPELAAFYNEITDYKTAADVGLDRPDMNVELVNIQPTADHQEFSQRLLDFANTGNGEYIFRDELSDSEKQAKMLIVTGLGKKASLSPKLVNPDYHEGDDTKIGYAAKNISDYYYKYNDQKGTQFVFCDLSTPKKGEWSAYQELKDRLVNQYGISEAEIQFMQDASTEKKRKEYIAKMNSGDIRVLFGSTTTLGTGVNAQERCVAIHHMDLPWRPSDMEQRNGRGVRKGNKIAKLYAGNKVNVYVYAVERSLDSYNFYLLQAKQEFIRQMKTGALGKRSFDQGGEDETNGMPFAEYVAITSGNTDLLDRAKLEKRILGLESERKAFNAQQRNVAVRLEYAQKDLERYKEVLGNLRKDYEVFEANAEIDNQGNYINTLRVGTGLLSEEDKGRYLQDNARRLITEETEVGSIYGFPVVMRPQTVEEKDNKNFNYAGNIFFVKGSYSYRINNGRINQSSRQAAAVYPLEALSKLPDMVEKHEKAIARLERDIPEMERIAAQEWDKVQQLSDMKDELVQLDRKIQQAMNNSLMNQSQEGRKNEELPFKITKKSWGSAPWVLEYKATDYPYISRDDKRQIEEKLHGGFKLYANDEGILSAIFRHQYGAEAAIKEISRLNAEHKDSLEWLVAATKDVTDEVCLPAYTRLKELGYDRFGNKIEQRPERHLHVISLGDYAAVRELVYAVKGGGNSVANEVAASALAYAIEQTEATPDNTVLVAMPGHDGRIGAMTRLASLVEEKTGIPFVETLESVDHPNLYTWKKEHPGQPLPDIFFSVTRHADQLQGKTVIIIDDFLDTGHTALSAIEAFETTPILLVLGNTENYKDHENIDVTMTRDGVDYIKNVTPVGVGFTGKTEKELETLMRKARENEDFRVYWDARRQLEDLGYDYNTGYPMYLVSDVVDRWERALSETYGKPLVDILAKGDVEHIFTEEERQYLSDKDITRLRNTLMFFQGKEKYEYIYDSHHCRMLMIVYDVLREKVDSAIAATQIAHAGAQQSYESINEHRSMEQYPIINDGHYWYVGDSNGYGIKAVYAEQIAKIYNGEPVESDERMMMRFGGRDAAVNFVSEVSMLNERYTNKLRDGLIEKMKAAGINVSTDWQEGERVLAQENGRVTMMGSRVDKKQIAISRYFEDKELTEKQRAFVDVYSGKEKDSFVEIVRSDRRFVLSVIGGKEEGLGTKHSLMKHFGTTVGVFNEEDILTIVDVIEKGECFSVNNKYGRERKIYKYVEDEVKFTVVTDVTKNGEVFGDFYTNQKARPLSKRMANADTLKGADAYSGNALPAAKVRQNSDISKENQEKIREQRILGNNMYGYVSDMNGMPLMVYHGTAIGLNRFEEYREDKPIWFTPDRDYADIYANRTERNIYRSDIRPSYIKMYHPVYLGNLDRGIDSFFTREDWLRELQDATDIGIEELRRDVPDISWLYQAVNSEAFKEMMLRHGYDGIIGQERGHASYAVFANYQVEQAAKAQLSWHLRFFRTPNGESYGFVRQDGSIYIDRRIATAETPIHEYTHLWAEVLRQRNPDEWKNIVQMMKDTPEVWNYVKQSYPHLMTDDQITDEALAQFSGKRGYQKLQEFVDGQDNKSIFDKMMEVLGKFWSNVAEFFGIHYTNKEEVADRILFDLLSEVNPLDYKQNEVTTLRELQNIQQSSKDFKEWFGDWQKPSIYRAYMVDNVARLQERYPSALPQKFYDHSTVTYGLQAMDDREGQRKQLHIIGRLITDKVDVLVVENPESHNQYAHITLATAPGVRPVESNKELEEHAADIVPLDDYVDVTFKNILNRNLSKVTDETGKPLVVEHATNANFTVFDISHIGENSRDNGLFGAGFYFGTHAPGWMQGANNIMKVYLDIKHPFEIADTITLDIYSEIRYKLDTPAMRGLTLTGFNDKQIQVGEYIDHIKAVDNLIKENMPFVEELMSKDEDLQFIHPDQRLRVWREHEINNRSGIGSLGMSWQNVISEHIGSYQFTTAAIQDGYDGVIVDRDHGEKEYVAFEPNQIKSATENIGTFLLENNDIRYHFIGEKGAHNLDLSDGGNRMDMLHHAEEMEQTHNTVKQIKPAPVYQESTLAHEPKPNDYALDGGVEQLEALRHLTVADREAGGAMVDHLSAMGITVHTDLRENRRILKSAEQDHSEAGRVRHFKTSVGESYGFAYKGELYLDLRKIDAELPLHGYAHLWCESMRRINPDNWNSVVATIKDDAASWEFVRRAYPGLTDDSDLAEEVIAQYSGKRGAAKLQTELERMTPRDDNYRSRWNNIFQNVSKAIQDFWKHIGDSLNIRYDGKEDIADQILKDFATKVSPIKKLEKYLQQQDKEYAAAVAVGDIKKAHSLFAAALAAHSGNGVTPFMSVGGYRGKMDILARNVKSTDFIVSTKAISEAADLMSPLIPDNAVLIPAPSHKGMATDMLDLAHAIESRTGVAVYDVLKSDPRQSQYQTKRETGKALTADQLGIHMEGELPKGKLPVVIDNVVNTGNTAEACIKALGGGIVLSLASAVSQERHVATLKSAAPIVYDTAGNLIPLSERFELKNKYLGRVMHFKLFDDQIVRSVGTMERLKILSTETMKNEDNSHVGYSKTVSHGVDERGMEKLERTIFYNGTVIGCALADIDTGKGNIFRVLGSDAYRETYLLDVRVHSYDTAPDRWEGIDGMELDGHYDYGCIRFANEEELVQFYVSHKEDVDYRNRRYNAIDEVYITKGRAAAEVYSKNSPVQYIYKPVPPMHEWVDVNTDRTFLQLPDERREALRYRPGEKIEDYKTRNQLYAGHQDFAYYFWQKYAARQEEIKAIFSGGITDDNVVSIAHQVGALVDSPVEGFEIKSLMNYVNTIYYETYYKEFTAAFEEREKAFRDNLTVKEVQGLDGYSVDEIKDLVRDYVQDLISDLFMEDDIYIKEISVIGSRSRGEARPDSDLDILLEYGGKDVREDNLYNILNALPMEIEGIKVDINPINERYSLNTSDWLARDARWREEDNRKQHNMQKTMDIKENLSQLLQEVMPHEGARYDFAVGFIADDTDHRTVKQDLLVTTLKNTPNGFLAGEDVDGYLNISRLSSYEQDFIHKMIRERQLVELIGDGKSIHLSGEGFFTSEYTTVEGKGKFGLGTLISCDGQLQFVDTVDRTLFGPAPVSLLNISADAMDKLYVHVSNLLQQSSQQIDVLAKQYRSIFLHAAALKSQVNGSSSLYDALNSLSSPVVDGVADGTILKEWAAVASIDTISSGSNADEYARLNDLTNGELTRFVNAVADLRPDQADQLYRRLIVDRAVYSTSVLDALYTSTLEHYERVLPHENVQRDLVDLLGTTNGKELMDWVSNGVTNPGERLQQFKDALSYVSIYDADRLLTAIVQRNERPEREVEQARLNPKNLLEDHYAMVMAYYLTNHSQLTQGQKAVFQQLDRAATPEALSEWVSNILTGDALTELSGVPENVREEVRELAYAIAETTENPEDIIKSIDSIGIVNDLRFDTLVAVDNRFRQQHPDEILLIKNGQGMTAVGKSAHVIAEITGWPSNLVNHGKGLVDQVLHINSNGYDVLADKDLNLHVVNAPVSLRPFMEQPYNGIGYALQTIDYNISFVQHNPVSIETDGSLNIGNFKAKTLDFHPMGLGATSANGEKLVIRDIPANYYHPDGTLVIADYINGHRETIENALSMVQPIDLHGYDSIDEMPTVLESYDLQKSLHPDELLLFRQKGFVEAFREDAVRLAESFGLPLYERKIDNQTVQFAMMDTSDYMELSDSVTIDVPVANTDAVDTRRAVSESLGRMQEQLAADATKKGFGAEIFPTGEGRYSVHIVHAATLHPITSPIELTEDEIARYKQMVGPAAMSERGDFVLDMADKYFGDHLRLDQEHSRVRQDYAAAGLEGIAILLDNPVEHHLNNGDVERFTAYTVDKGYIMLYKSIEDAEQSFNPYMLSDLSTAQQLKVLDSIDLPKNHNQNSSLMSLKNQTEAQGRQLQSLINDNNKITKSKFFNNLQEMSNFLVDVSNNLQERFPFTREVLDHALDIRMDVIKNAEEGKFREAVKVKSNRITFSDGSSFAADQQGKYNYYCFDDKIMVSELVHEGNEGDTRYNYLVYAIAEKRELEKHPYQIHIGTWSDMSPIFGEIHVEMSNNTLRVKLEDAQAIAESLGGEARLMNGRLWGDFDHEADARQFGDRVAALNIDRMVAEREAARNENPFPAVKNFDAELLGQSTVQQQLIQQRFDVFKAEHGEEPLYAEVTIRFKDDGVQQTDMIKLSNDTADRDNDKVFFNVDGIEGLKDLLRSDNGEDFEVIDIEDIRFYAKNMYFDDIAKQSELINEYPQLKEFASMEEKKQESAVQEQEAQEQQEVQQASAAGEKKNPFANIDYSKYSMPEGVTVEKANVFKQSSGENAGKYAISAIIDGKRKTRTMYYNDVTAFFNAKKGQEGAKATLDQIVAKYFGKSTAESMSIGSVGEAEKVRGEQEEAQEQAAAAEEEKKEAQKEAQEQKKQEESKKEKKEVTPAAVIQAELLVGALVAASQSDGVWLNKSGKQSPEFTRENQVVSPFNALMMGLHSDANGYKTNRYMSFGDGRSAGVSVKKGESGIPFNWYNFDKYVSRINSNDIIDKAKYESLPAEEKDLYKVLRTKEERRIFNIDQTTMSSVAKPQYKEFLAAQEKSVLGRGEKDVVAVDEGKELYESFKEKNPDTLLVLRTGDDRFELHGADAEKAAAILHLKLDSKEGEAASLVIPEKQLDTMLPKLVRDGQRVSVQNNPDKPEVLRRYGTADHIYGHVSKLLEGLGKVAGEGLALSSMKDTAYDHDKDILIVNDSRASVAGEEVSTAIARANDTFRAVVAYTGAEDRLNRGARGKMLPEDAVKYDKLVQEAAAGVLMSRYGLPASLSKDNLPLVPYWERELKEDPKLVDRLEGDVNNALSAVSAYKKGQAPDYAAMRGEKNIEAMKPKYYTIASQIAAIPDMEKRHVVIVRDTANKSAAVVLPAGASLDVNNEAPGMNKNRFVVALKKEGIDDVQFYNAGGALGLQQPNEFFADKTVEVARLKQYQIQTVETLDLKDEIARTSKVDIAQVSMIRDDDNKHVLYVKPSNGEAFTIYPEADDIRAFFAGLKNPEKFDAIRENLGQKYYAFVQNHPEFKANVLMPDVAEDLDISRITKVNIVKDKNKEKSYFMFATIDGESQKPREVSGVQAQRMWLVDDRDMYKVRLAALLFEDKLGLSEGQAAAQFRDNNEGQGVDNASETPEQEETEEQQQGRRGGFRR